MTLLARNAEQLFWLARYVERASSLARIIEIHSTYGRGGEYAESWAWLIALYSDEERFGESYVEPSLKNVIDFFVSDVENPGSIRFAIRAARENARALRAVIPTELWVNINEFHNRLTNLGDGDFDLIHLSRTCGLIKYGCHAQLGVVDATLYRDEGERFYRLGLMIERADQTSRLLDVKFAQLATRGQGAEAIVDTAFWALVLRSAAAYQSFRRFEPSGAEPDRVAKFLLANTCQPRSVTFCISEIDRVLQELRSGYNLRQTNRALELTEILIESLQSVTRDGDLVERLHAVNDWLQSRLIELTTEIASSFFGVVPEVPASEVPLAPLPPSQKQSDGQTQSQVQSQTTSKSQGLPPIEP